jgi:alkylated DNA repair dioxygenase AlkB
MGATELTPPLLTRLPGLQLRCWPGWLPQGDAVFQRLLAEVPWKQESLTLYGRTHPIPRLTCWMGDPGCAYTYSGLRNRIEPWISAVEVVRGQVEAATGCRFNSLLLNLYRDGRDAMGWHADDEPELDAARPIASLSLGAARTFRLRPRRRRGERWSEGGQCQPLAFELGHGDLLVMDPPTQEHWEHQVPRRLRLRQPRLNLTFRVVRHAPGGAS